MKLKVGSMVLGLCLASSGWAEPTISQDVLDAIASDGSVRVMARLDVPFTPEGELSEAERLAQRSLIADAQGSFEAELRRGINNGGIDDPSGVGGTISLINKAIKFETVPYVAMQVTGVSLSAMLNDDSVARISLDRPDDASLTSGLKVIGADVVHAGGNTGAGQTVAVVGSGVDGLPNVLSEHEACFSTTDDTKYASTVCPDKSIEQKGIGAGAACKASKCDHETKVAKVLTAVAPDVSLIPVQVYSQFEWQNCNGSPAPCGRSFQSDQVRALEYLLKLKQDGVDISAVNLSLNGGVKQAGSCDDDSRKESVDNLLSVGVVTIASAGNQGFADGVQAPACISSVVAVGATDVSGGIAEFSNRGGELDLLAPGVMSVDGEDLQGTSYAAPMVAGSYALVRAARPDADVAEVMGLLKDSGQDVDGKQWIANLNAIVGRSCSSFGYGWSQFAYDGRSNIHFCKQTTTSNPTTGLINVRGFAPGHINCSTKFGSGWKNFAYDGMAKITFCMKKGNVNNKYITDVNAFQGNAKCEGRFNGKNWKRVIYNGYSVITFCAKFSEQVEQQVINLKVIQPVQHTLTVTKTVNGTITTTDNTINCGETCQADYEVDSTVTLTAIPETGYTFTNWTGDCSGTSATTTVTLDSAKSCEAVFEKSEAPTTLELVQQAYCRVLERPVDDSGRVTHVNYLNSGNSVKDLMRVLLLSAEHKQRFYDGKTTEVLLKTMFDHILARETDPSGLNAWINAMDVEGWSWDTVINTILDEPMSREYDTRFGNDTVPGNGRIGCGEDNIELPEPVSSCDIVSDGLVACLPFSGNSLDASGNNNHGTVYGGATLITDESGNTGNAYSFDGKDDYIQIPNNESLQFGYDNFTFHSIVKMPLNSNKKQYNKIFAKPRNTSTKGVSLYTNYAKPCFQSMRIGNGGNGGVGLCSKKKLNDDKWHYVTGIREGDLMKLYVDGNFEGSAYGASEFNIWSTEPLTIAHQISSTGKLPFKGDISEVRVYNRALSDSEVKKLAGVEEPVATNGCETVSDGLVACYPFPGDAKDYSGNGNHGTEYGGLNYTDGKIGQAANFDGIDDYINVADDDSLDDTSYLTIALWVNFHSFNATGTHTKNLLPIINKHYSSEIKGKNSYGLSLHNESRDIDFTTFDSQNLHGGVSNSFGGTPDSPELMLSQWYHLVAIFDKGQIRIFLNGSLITSQETNITHIGNSPEPLKIGDWFYQHSASYPIRYSTFEGLMDDVRIYNRAITEQEIQTLYNLVQPPVPSGLTVTKTGNGRGSILSKVKGEDWTINCGSNCQQANYEYAPNSKLIIRAYSDKGFTFKGWTGDCTGTNSKVTMTIDSAKTCTAQFEPEDTAKQLTITKTGNGNITSKDGYLDCGTTCSAYYKADKIVRLQVTPATDNIFMGWSGDCNGLKTSQVVTMDTAKNCTATFQPLVAGNQTFTVNNTGEVGTIKITKTGDKKANLVCRGREGCTQAQHDYQFGDKVKVQAIPTTNFKFETGSGDCDWKLDDKGRASATVLMDSAKNCTANFSLQDNPSKPMYLLTIQTGGTGSGTVNNPARIDCGTDCTADHYSENTTVWVKAKPGSLSKFAGWTGDCEGKNSGLKITMTKDMTCTVNFQSDLELIADEMIEAFYANGKLANGSSVAEVYPRASNEPRVKEAFWLAMTAIMLVDQHLTVSNTEQWPTQLDSIELLPNDPNVDYTSSIKIMDSEIIGIEVKLLTADNTEQETGIAIYYSDNPPDNSLDDGSGWGVSSAYFSRYAFWLR
ncbi:S8 family serine peptidase [Thiotrichales bacterium HSG1]|nr:S8 family serine peptidase [Thiotrichales bacterium HSG1]